MTAFERLGALVYHRRRLIVAIWAVAILGALTLAPRTASVLRAGGFSLDDLEVSRARALLERELGFAPSALVLAYHSPTLSAGSAPFEAAVAAAIRDLSAAPHVSGLRSHLLASRQISADRHTAYDVVLLDLPPDESPEALQLITDRLHPVAQLEVSLAGGPAFYGDVQAVSESDLRRSELVSLPLAAVALLLVFGSVVAAGTTLAVGGSAVLIALALIYIVASLTPMSIFVLNLATLLGLGLGVDYSLLMTSRYREELSARSTVGGRQGEPPARGSAVEAAVQAAVATAGRAVFFSGLTVLLGLSGLVLFEFMILRSVGIAGAIVVLLAVLAALTLLPALLGILGDRIDALAVRRIAVSPEGEGPWATLAGWVMGRPVIVLVPTLALLLLLGAPFLHVRFNAPDASILPPSVPSRAAHDLLTREFGEGEFAPLFLAIRTSGPVVAPENLARLYDYSRRLASDPRVRRVESLVDVDPRLLTSSLSVGSDVWNVFAHRAALPVMSVK